MDAQSLDPANVNRLGVFLPNWVGDAVMATPTLRALRDHFSGARIIGLMRPAIADVVAATGLLDEAWFFDRRGWDRAQGLWAVSRRLRKARLDLAVLLPNSFAPAWISWLAGARERVGYVRREPRGWLLTRRLTPPRRDGRLVPSSTLDYYLKLAAAVGCSPGVPAMELATTTADERAADEAWKTLGLGNRPVVAVNASGAFGAAKLWPDEYFTALARQAAEVLGVDVLILCGPQERTRAQRIAQEAAHPQVVGLAGFAPSIGLSKACVRRSRVLVTTDSGPRHFAAAFGIPSVVLFGPTYIAWSDTHSASECHLQLAVDCGPCQRRVCPAGHHKCMRDLSVACVFDALSAQLEAGGSRCVLGKP